MRILVEMGHPTDVNLFKNVIWELEKRGHTVKIAARRKENTLALLDTYGFNYEVGKHYDKLISKAIGVLSIDAWLYGIAKQFNPDVFVSPGTPYSAQVSWLLRKPHIAFPDTEIANFAARLMLPFTDTICTSSSFKTDFGSKQVRFNSYFELAYLHPNHFTPDPSILEELTLGKDDRYILLRFSSLTSHHDIGAKGFNFKTREEMLAFIKELEGYGQVFLTSEIPLTEELEKYRISVPIKNFHSFVYYAAMYIGEGAKTASEAAILGVPSIYVSTTRRGYLDELEEKYGLAFTISNKDKALEKAMELLEDKDIKNKWQSKREIMLNEKIDVTKFMVDVIEKKGNGCAE